MLPTSRFLSFLNQYQLFNSRKKALLAVSGGRDSVLMVELFNAAKLSFGIAHCNFGLRGEESEGDQLFVNQIAEKYKVPFYSVKFDTQAFAEKNKISIQMAARDLRYNWFETVRAQNGFDCIALAHHASDVTETILLNLTRGTGIAGLHGILPKRDNFIRPLLFLTRDEISEIIDSEKIAYREDSSNLSAKYARNKIRLEVIPKLKELNAGLDSTFEKNSRRFGQIEEFLNGEVDKLRKLLFKPVLEDIVEIDLKHIQQLEPLELLLFELFKPYGFTEAVLEDFTRTWNGQSGKVFESATHNIVLDREKLILEKKKPVQSDELLWFETMESINYSSVQYTCKINGTEAVNISHDRNKAFFDKDLLQYPLTLRHWKKGDYFYPFGMKGKKKLSDFLRELKIPITQKTNIPLLINGNGDILWVVGYRTDNRYKISSDTKKVITFEKTTRI